MENSSVILKDLYKVAYDMRFFHMTTPEFKKSLSLGEQRNVPKDEKIIASSDAVTNIFLILSGEALCHDDEHDRQCLLGPGDMIGDISFFRECDEALFNYEVKKDLKEHMKNRGY